MFHQSKNLSHQQALSQIQSLFPSLSLPTFSANTSLKTILQSISTTLPVPQQSSHKNILNNMKNIVDSQQYKIQRNMIDIQNYNEFTQSQFQNEGCSLNFYQQRSTAIEFSKKISDQTDANGAMSDQSEDLWWNLQQKNTSQEDLEKQCFSFFDC